MQTEKLAYSHDRQELETDDKVDITGQSGHLTADSMTYHMKTNQAIFSGQVKGDFIEKADS
jgi:LPS export ABC transporter protein LptC